MVPSREGMFDLLSRDGGLFESCLAGERRMAVAVPISAALGSLLLVGWESAVVIN